MHFVFTLLFSDLLAALKRNAHFWRPVLESGTRKDIQNKGLGRMAGGGGRGGRRRRRRRRRRKEGGGRREED